MYTKELCSLEASETVRPHFLQMNAEEKRIGQFVINMRWSVPPKHKSVKLMEEMKGLMPENEKH